MSVESLGIAFHHSRAKGTARVVLLGIANHDGDGGAWPAMSTLAKYASVDVSSARKAVARLEELGEVRRQINAGGTQFTAEHERPNLYHFLLRCPADCDGTSKHRTRRDTRTVELQIDPQAQTSGGAETSGDPQAQTSAEPPTNHPDLSSTQSDPSTHARAIGKGACGHKLLPGFTTDCEWGCSTAKVIGLRP